MWAGVRKDGAMSLWEPSDLSAFRVSYDRGELLESDIASTPLSQFQQWWEEAVDSGLSEPNAMIVSTVDGSGQPTARTVLLKGVDPAGFRFFTNYSSRKASAIAEDPRVALVFPWFPLHRQVTVLGRAERMDPQESAAYFHSRPRGSQLAAWASRQSTLLEGRSSLDERMAELEQRWPEGTEIPAPDFWGGFLVRPESVEFWHGRVSRMHDRLRYESVVAVAAMDDEAAWQLRRYAP